MPKLTHSGMSDFFPAIKTAVPSAKIKRSGVFDDIVRIFNRVDCNLVWSESMNSCFEIRNQPFRGFVTRGALR
jgi:hypothetical protein